jgi:HEPN domain-containing protein
MSAPDPNALRERAAAWAALAEIDRRSALACLDADPPLPSSAAYHCQQAAEKLLKAILVRAGILFRKTHDLRELGDAVVARYDGLLPLARAVEGWTVWGIAYRYPAEAEPEPEPSAAELGAALSVIDRLMAEARHRIAGAPADEDDGG